MLSADELERYARHIVLREVGGPGQQALKRARVLVIGAGGLGAPVLMYLGAAGVGTLGVIDDDEVSLSNLQRQVIHGTPDLGMPKVESAKAALARINPHVNVVAHRERLTAANALARIGDYDIVCDGSDNFATRYLVSDACYLAKKPLVTAAVGIFDGTLTTIRAHEKGKDGKPNPSYRCLFPEPPPAGTVPACAEAGILAVATMRAERQVASMSAANQSVRADRTAALANLDVIEAYISLEKVPSQFELFVAASKLLLDQRILINEWVFDGNNLDITIQGDHQLDASFFIERFERDDHFSQVTGNLLNQERELHLKMQVDPRVWSTT